jgi:hypothetical protein
MNLRLPIGLSAALLASPASASVVTYFNDYAGWSAAAGPTTMIDFVPPGGTAQVVPGDFYQDLGVTLSGYWTNNPVAWSLLPLGGSSSDGWHGRPSGFPPQVMGALNFSEPIQAFAVDQVVASQMGVSFFLGGVFISTVYIAVPQGQWNQNHFFGWRTDFAFDRVVIEPGGINGGADNVYFSTIPAPGAVALGVIATLAAERRRRR